MKKIIKISLAAAIIVICLVAIMSITSFAEGKQITVSYLNTYNPMNPNPGLDKTAYTNGVQTVGAGEEFTLPTTSSHSYALKDGYQLRWYSHDGRSYKGGEVVSFTEDTKLFRVVAKEVYNLDELNSAMTSESHAAILMKDIEAENGTISIWGQNQAILDLGGHNITISRNGSIMGGQRSGSFILGKGTLKVTNPNGKVGEYTIFDCKGHGYNGDEGEVFVGRDVTIDAPNFFLCYDYEGNHVTGYPHIKIYGTLNVYYILRRTGGTNAARIDFMETCNVTLGAPYLNIDIAAPTDNLVYNRRTFDINIYGGIFRLPAAASEEIYWSTDNYAKNSNGDADVLTENNKDEISILGGTFILPDGKAPGFGNFLKKTYLLAADDRHEGINLSGLINKNGDATAYANYKVQGGYKFSFSRNGSLTVTDNVGTGRGGTYYYTLNLANDGTIDSFSLFADAEKTKPTDVFEIKRGTNTATLKISFAELNGNVEMSTKTLLGTGVTAVVPKNSCTHSFEPIASTDATCIAYATQTYTCSECEHVYTVSYGDYAQCAWELTDDVLPTMSSAGIKYYICTVCGGTKEEAYYLDLANEYIEVTVTGGIKVSVKASDVYSLTKLDDGTYRLTGVKDFGEYSATDIIEINIYGGISDINISVSNSSILKMNILDGATVSISSFASFSALTEINIAKANVNFVGGANSVIKSIKSEVAGASVSFASAVFKKKASLTEIKMSAGSEYAFGTDSFRECGLEELIFPDNSTIRWGTAAFAECQHLEYIYFGANIGVKKVNNDAAVFDGVSRLSKVVIMDLNYLGQWAFSTKNPGANYGPLCDLTMYIHSTDMTFNNNFLNNRKGDYNVYIYTVQQALPSGISNCNFTIYQGIPHAYVEGDLAPTCTETGTDGFTTDCACQKQLSGSADVKKYVNSFNEFEELKYQSIEIPALGHTTDGEISKIVYLVDYMSTGDIVYVCTRCSKEHTVEGGAKAMFKFRGYSIKEDESAFCIDFGINAKAIYDYEKANNLKINVGVFTASADKLGSMAPIDAILEGTVPMIHSDISIDNNLCNVVIKIKGFETDAAKEMSLVSAAYMSITSEVGGEEQADTFYFQRTQCESLSAYSVSQYLIDTENVA